MALDLVAYVYTADNAQDFQLGVAQYIAAQLDAGSDPIIGGHNQLGTETLYQLPNGLTPRGVVVSNAAGKKRFVACMTEDAPLFTGAVGTINLQDGAGVITAYTRYKQVNQKARVRDPNS